MNMKAYDASALELTFDSSESGGEEGGDIVVPEIPAGAVSSGGVTISSDNVTFTGLTVKSCSPPTAGYIKNAIAFDVTPQTANGAYTGSARVTMTIPQDWDKDKVFGFVMESDGSITVLSGAVGDDNTFYYECPHFSTTGIFEATAIADVDVSAKNIYVPVGGTAVINGLTGNINAENLDKSVATYTKSNSTITLNGVKAGKTSFVVGDTPFNIYVVPDNEKNQTTKYIYINVTNIEHCTVYYSINGSPLYNVEKPGLLIDQTYYDGFNISFYAAPDEGYALTKMTTTNSAGQYYSLPYTGDISNSDAWPYDANGNVKMVNGSSHGFRWGVEEGNLTKDRLEEIFNEAITKYGCDGALTFTKNRKGTTTNNSSNTDNFNSSLSFIAEQLPSFEKKIIGYKRAGELKDGDTKNENLNINGYTDYYKYDEDVTLEFGDTLLYQFMVTSYSTNVIYTNIELTDSKINYIKEITDGTFNTKGVNNYYAQYVITTNDINNYVGGKFVNDAQLKYSYSSKYSCGVYGGEASDEATCEIIGVVSYAWVEGTPEGIVNDTTTYGLPNSERVIVGGKFRIKEYQGSRSYTDKNGVKWVYTNQWGVIQDENGAEKWFTVTQEILNRDYIMNKSRSITFYGKWEEAQKYDIKYQWKDDAPQSKTPPTGGSYYEGDTYAVDNTYNVGDKITEGDVKYTFQGWTLNGMTVNLGASQTMDNADVTYIGTWTKTANTASLTISKSISGGGTADSDQSFLFKVEGENVDLTVNVKAGGSVTIDGLTVGKTYTITELTDWSWRYKLEKIGNNVISGNNHSVEKTIAANGNTVTFTNAFGGSSWLGHDAFAKNIFTKNESGVTVNNVADSSENN